MQIPPAIAVDWAQALQELTKFFRENTGSFSAAGFGAFLGSGFAFLLESRRRRHERRDKEHDSALTAQYALQAQWNTLEGIRQQFLEKLRDDSARHLKLIVFDMPEARLTIPFDRLIFVAKRDDPNLLQEIRIAENGYIAAMGSLRERNTKLEALYYDPTVTRETFDMATGKARGTIPAHKEFLLKSLTDGLYREIDRAIPKLDAAFKAMQACIKRNFPSRFRALRTVDDDEQVSK